MSENDVFADAMEEPVFDGQVADATDPEDMFGENDAEEYVDLFDDDDFDEVDSGEAVKARDARVPYEDATEVGLRADMWVPVEILAARAEKSFTPRFPPKTCYVMVDVKDPKTGAIKKKPIVAYDKVVKALEDGGEEIIDDKLPLPYFVVAANHVAPRFGRRNYDYDLSVPVFAVKTAFAKPNPRGTGDKNTLGYTLRKATGVTEAGEKVTFANMGEIAKRMELKIMMVQLRINRKKSPSFRKVLDHMDNPINVLMSPDDGNPVTVVKEGEGYFLKDGGDAYEDSLEKLFLIPGGDEEYAIRDQGDSSGPLQEKYHPQLDYLNTWVPFQPVPERKVTVTTLDGAEVEGEITWDTIGEITVGATPGRTHVDVLLTATGETITVVWIGHWRQKPPKKAESTGAVGDVKPKSAASNNRPPSVPVIDGVGSVASQSSANLTSSMDFTSSE